MLRFLACLLLLPFPGFGQDPDAVYVDKRMSLTIEVKNDALAIVEEGGFRKKFIRNFQKYATEEVYYSDFDPIDRLEAEVEFPRGSTTKREDVNTIETQDFFEPGIFYGGHKRQRITFPVSITGTTAYLSYRKKILEPHLINMFFFDDDIPVGVATYTATFPKSVVVGHKLFGRDADRIGFTKTEQGNNFTYTWRMESVPAYRREDDAPSRLWVSPHIILFIESYNTRGGLKPVSRNAGDLFNWYAWTLKQIPSQNSIDYADFVKKLTSRDASDIDKARTVFQWTQQHIRYVAFEDGMAGFIPRPPADVYTKKYGDCKDMAYLMKDMLVMSGVTAYPVWIGTRRKPYAYTELPATSVSNHMISAVKNATGYYFLDATDPFVPFGFPSSMIQGKEAMIWLGDAKYEIVRIPEMPRNQSQRIDSIRVSLTGQDLRGAVSARMTGYVKGEFQIHRLRAELQRDQEYIKELFLTQANNNATISNLILPEKSDVALTGKVAFDFTIPSYAKQVGNKMYVNLNAIKTTKGTRAEAGRISLLENEFRFEEHSTTILQVPEGFSPSFVPNPFVSQSPEFGASISYEAAGNSLIMKKSIYHDFLYLGPERFAAWNQFLDQLHSAEQKSVTLTKP